MSGLIHTTASKHFEGNKCIQWPYMHKPSANMSSNLWRHSCYLHVILTTLSQCYLYIINMIMWKELWKDGCERGWPYIKESMVPVSLTTKKKSFQQVLLFLPCTEILLVKMSFSTWLSKCGSRNALILLHKSCCVVRCISLCLLWLIDREIWIFLPLI